MTTSVAIVVFDDVEVLDACGPFEVFSVANRVAAGAGLAAVAPFAVSLVSAQRSLSVRARGGLHLTADWSIADMASADVIVVPGGVTATVEADREVIDWLRARGADTPTIASVCNGAMILAQAGLLAGRQATTHWEDAAELRARFPDVDVRSEHRYLDLGDIATSAGVSAGIDLALHLVGRFATPELAVATARQLDYPWNSHPPNRSSEAGEPR